ncbi:MAG: response regulator [Phyllobacterium sp.]
MNRDTIGPNPSSATSLILCVEDESDLRSDIVEELMAAGHDVMAAGNGREALDLLDERRPDLVLCDITMPVMGGFEFMKEMRRRWPHFGDVPFVFLTALADREHIIHGKTAGADDYLVKPIDYDVLLATIQARLAQVQRMRNAGLAGFEQERKALTALAARGASDAIAAIGSTLDRMAAGVILLETGGAMKFMNSTARDLITEADGIAWGNTGLRGATPPATQSLKQALADVASTPAARRTITLPRSLRLPLLVEVNSLRAEENLSSLSTAVFIVDPERRSPLSPLVAAHLYGLTPTEARLAAALTDGKRLDEIGAEMGVAQTTITFHLQNIFRKTQTSRQADLVALLMRSATALKTEG